jgi:hypothetical protein
LPPVFGGLGLNLSREAEIAMILGRTSPEHRCGEPQDQSGQGRRRLSDLRHQTHITDAARAGLFTVMARGEPDAPERNYFFHTPWNKAWPVSLLVCNFIYAPHEKLPDWAAGFLSAALFV